MEVMIFDANELEKKVHKWYLIPQQRNISWILFHRTLPFKTKWFHWFYPPPPPPPPGSNLHHQTALTQVPPKTMSAILLPCIRYDVRNAVCAQHRNMCIYGCIATDNATHNRDVLSVILEYDFQSIIRKVGIETVNLPLSIIADSGRYLIVR